MKKFTHQAPVVVVKKEKHPDAEKLSIVRLCDNTVQVVVNTDSWQDGELAVWIQPQSIVDCWKEPFTFLNRNDGEQEVRVKAVKLRGYLSEGCLVKVPEELLPSVKEGDDLSQVFGVKHWEPELTLSSGGNFTSGESLSKYDIDSGVKLHKYFEDNELVWVEEKIHGENCRVYFDGTKFKVGTRNNWVDESPKSNHWTCFHTLSEACKNFLRENTHFVLYGEATGNVKGFKYGLEGGKRAFYAFDIYDRNEERFLDIDEREKIFNTYNVLRPPFIGKFPHSFQELTLLAAGKSRVQNATNVMEGVVVRPLYERKSPKGERVIYKIISKEYNQ